MTDDRVHADWTRTHRRVWVVKYEHKHGDDLTVCASEEAAILTAIGIAKSWLNDFDEEKEAPTDDDRDGWWKIVEDWSEHSGNTEAIHIDEHQVNAIPNDRCEGCGSRGFWIRAAEDHEDYFAEVYACRWCNRYEEDIEAAIASMAYGIKWEQIDDKFFVIPQSR